MQGFLFREVDSRGLPVEADSADAAFLAENGATDLVIPVGARRGSGLGESESELNPFVFHEWNLFFGNMETVKDPVKDGSQDDAEENDQNEAAEEGVAGGEKFRRSGGHFISVDRAHSAHQHGGFQHGLIPDESSDLGVADDPDAHGHPQNSKSHGEMKQDAAKEDGVWGHGLAMVLVREERVGHERLVADAGEDGKRGEGAMGKRGEEVGRSWIRTSEGVSQQIYSLPRLATSVSARERERLAKKWCGVKRVPVGSKIASGGRVRVEFRFTRC